MFFTTVCVLDLIILCLELNGTVNKDLGDVHENVTEKWTPHPFKPFRDFHKSPCYLKERNLGWN